MASSKSVRLVLNNIDAKALNADGVRKAKLDLASALVDNLALQMMSKEKAREQKKDLEMGEGAGFYKKRRKAK